MEKKFDLEDRLVAFAGNSILFINDIPGDKAGSNLSGQLTRSATSSALNFGEAQGAESNKDKIHKLSIYLKELKETRVAFRILKFIKYGNDNQSSKLLDECEQLIAIIASIIKKKKIQSKLIDN